MSKAQKMYQCTLCYSRYESEKMARHCCEPVDIVYVCGACGSLADDDVEAALCCLGDCPKCARVFDVLDVEAECDLGFDPVYHCTQCGWRTGDAIPATAEELENNGQGRMVE